MKKFQLKVMASFYIFLYLFHWIFVTDGTFSQSLVTMLFHVALIAIIGILFLFFKSETGYVTKQHISKNRDTNLIGQILEMVENR